MDRKTRGSSAAAEANYVVLFTRSKGVLLIRFENCASVLANDPTCERFTVWNANIAVVSLCCRECEIVKMSVCHYSPGTHERSCSVLDIMRWLVPILKNG